MKVLKIVQILGNTFSGYAHLYSPLIPAGEVQLDQNTIQKQETQE